MKMVFGNAPGPGRPTYPTSGQLGQGLVPHRLFMSYCPWTPLVLDIIKICMDFSSYGAFPSSDVPNMVDQKYSWTSLVISTYPLYHEWNIGMPVVNICILWPPTLLFLLTCRMRDPRSPIEIILDINLGNEWWTVGGSGPTKHFPVTITNKHRAADKPVRLIILVRIITCNL
jgi:hypothetical protein